MLRLDSKEYFKIIVFICFVYEFGYEQSIQIEIQIFIIILLDFVICRVNFFNQIRFFFCKWIERVY